MKNPWRHSRMSSAVAVIASCISISCMIVAISNEEIKTRGIETIKFEFPKLVSRFDLDDVRNRVPDVASKIEGGASRIVEEVSSKATAISNALKNIPTEVSLGMDEVCWGASPNQCTPIWKGMDNWFPGPLEQFIKIKQYPWALDIIKLNILRAGTTIATALFFLALFEWLVSTLWWESTYHSATTEEEKEISREGEEIPREGEEKELPREVKKVTSRYVTIMVVLMSCLIMLLLLLNLTVVIGIDGVLARVTGNIQSVSTKPGNLRDLLIVSFVFNIVFLVSFRLSRRV
ncbi:hypothetical protein FOWG_17969 [Fusarium oxysporum f. sp. lycopersici MN25]|nr:hypothetical protein FOWG_17969 [Fusarium oxysporum f. sp. lycopersici MN25]